MDWDQDGHLDILSGCYWTEDEDGAHTLMLKGSGTLDFAEAVSLKTSTGRGYTNIIDPKAGDEDRTIENICTHQFAVDYDDDGDLDLVNGCFGSQFFLVTNGPDGLADVGEILPIDNGDHHSAPHLVDWDGDGDLDLLSGGASGGAKWFENTGTRAKPVWSGPVELIPTGEQNTQNGENPDTIIPAAASRIWVHDWNEDGRLDILLGDMVTLSRKIEGMTDEEVAKKMEEFNAKTADLMKDPRFLDFQEVRTKAGDDIESISEEIMTAYQEWSAEYSELYQSKEEFSPTERTGHVWLYLQKAG